MKRTINISAEALSTLTNTERKYLEVLLRSNVLFRYRVGTGFNDMIIKLCNKLNISFLQIRCSMLSNENFEIILKNVNNEPTLVFFDDYNRSSFQNKERISKMLTENKIGDLIFNDNVIFVLGDVQPEIDDVYDSNLYARLMHIDTINFE